MRDVAAGIVAFLFLAATVFTVEEDNATPPAGCDLPPPRRRTGAAEPRRGAAPTETTFTPLRS